MCFTEEEIWEREVYDIVIGFLSGCANLVYNYQQLQIKDHGLSSNAA